MIQQLLIETIVQYIGQFTDNANEATISDWSKIQFREYKEYTRNSKKNMQVICLQNKGSLATDKMSAKNSANFTEINFVRKTASFIPTTD